MPLNFVRTDITKMQIDAIVNTPNQSILGGGVVHTELYKVGGLSAYSECTLLCDCKGEEATITGAYNLPCKHLIHFFAPMWRGGSNNENYSLESGIRSSLEIAKNNNCESVAFSFVPDNDTYPKDLAFEVMVDTISEFLVDNEMIIYIVFYGESFFEINRERYSDISRFVSDNYIQWDSIRISYPDPYTMFEGLPLNGNLRGGMPFVGQSKSEALLSRIEQMDENSTIKNMWIGPRETLDTSSMRTINVFTYLYSPFYKNNGFEIDKKHSCLKRL